MDSRHKSTSGNRFSGGSDSSNAVFIEVHFFASVLLMETEDFPTIADGDEPGGNRFFKWVANDDFKVDFASSRAGLPCCTDSIKPMSLLIGTSSADGNWVYRMGSIDSAMIVGTLEVVCGWTELNVRPSIFLSRARGMTLRTRIGFVNEGNDCFTDIIGRQILDLDNLKVYVRIVVKIVVDGLLPRGLLESKAVHEKKLLHIFSRPRERCQLARLL